MEEKPQISSMVKRCRTKRNKSTKKGIINIIFIISVGLVLLNLMEMPNLLAQFIRLLTFIGFVTLAYYALKSKKWLGTAMFLIIGMLFQPSFGFAGESAILNIVDIILIILIGYSIYQAIYPSIKSNC